MNDAEYTAALNSDSFNILLPHLRKLLEERIPRHCHTDKSVVVKHIHEFCGYIVELLIHLENKDIMSFLYIMSDMKNRVDIRRCFRAAHGESDIKETRDKATELWKKVLEKSARVAKSMVQ